jgi:alkanesulfonate monooxygenase SsuD/methylene tetrahydromethanopterin reductase-like flavin-dependent oxidoreductase (luciferase family)
VAGRPFKVGVQLPEVERVVRWPELAAMARTAEAVGLDSIWVGDHLLYRYEDGETRGPWEAWTTLAGLAAVTSRVELGPLVASTSFHTPPMLAKLAATVDELSGGRLIVGLGAGWNETEYRAFGFPFDHRVSRFEEAFTIVRTLLREGAIDFSGDWYQVHEAELLPRPARAGGPPLMVGSIGERMLSITLPHVDAWNAWYAWFGNTPEGLRPLLERLDAACRSVGRDPETLERTVALHLRFPGALGRKMAESVAVPPIEGDPETIAAALRAYAALRIGHVQLVLDPITEESIARLGPVLEALDRG